MDENKSPAAVFLNGLIKENPTFVQLLGMCPTLAVTTGLKNGIGMAGAFIAVLICAVPILQMLLSALLYKMAAAAVQPVSDKRITACIRGVSEGYEMIVSVIFTVGFLFLLTIAVVAGVTT